MKNEIAAHAAITAHAGAVDGVDASAARPRLATKSQGAIGAKVRRTIGWLGCKMPLPPVMLHAVRGA